MGLFSLDKDSPHVLFPPPLVFLGFLLIGRAVNDLAGLNPAIPASVRLWLGGGSIIAGALLIVAALRRFHKAGTNAEPWKTDTSFVAEGIYRFTRNPMYLGMAVACFGISIAADCLGGLLTLPLSILAIRTQVIAREEAYLSAKFGQPYREYCARVRRWI